MASKVLKRANPNRHGWIILKQDTSSDGEIYYTVIGADEYEHEPETLAEAEALFDKLVSELINEPNWEAQADYDAAHGTINGYASFQYQREF